MVFLNEMLCRELWERLLYQRAFWVVVRFRAGSNFIRPDHFARQPSTTNPPPLTTAMVAAIMGLLPLLHWVVTRSNTRLLTIWISWRPRKFSSPTLRRRRSLGMFSVFSVTHFVEQISDYVECMFFLVNCDHFLLIF